MAGAGKGRAASTRPAGPSVAAAGPRAVCVACGAAAGCRARSRHVRAAGVSSVRGERRVVCVPSCSLPRLSLRQT